jgi:phosphatidylserine/phosphatidylglycerophosphate/cardiolipin synthase-like enzyme
LTDDARRGKGSARGLRETGIDVESLQRVAGEMAAVDKPRRRRTALPMLADHRAARDEPDAPEAMDLVAPVRPVPLELVSGRGHYDRVIDAIRSAHTSVWIATANVKELMIEDGRARPGQRRSMKRTSYVSVLSILDELAARGVELRLLHAELPSRPFREELANHPRLLGNELALRRCPRVHMKVVVIDGELLYLGSANWTGAGLGAKGSGRRNFELGIVTSDAPMLDEVQRLYDHVWRGAACNSCRLRPDCPGPLVDVEAQGPDTRRRTPKARKRRRRRAT